MTPDRIIFFVIAALAVLSALAVITRKNPITAVMFLVMHFLMLSGLYLSLHAQFVAAIQILVYAGAIMVLVVFVIMLLNLGNEESLRQNIVSKESIGISLAILLGGGIIYALTRTMHPVIPLSDKAIANGTIEGVGKALFTTYVFPFEMISLVLLAATVGAVVLTKRHLLEQEHGAPAEN
jgi:NADH-quinone oxidoreductase subunit J